MRHIEAKVRHIEAYQSFIANKIGILYCYYDIQLNALWILADA